MPVAWDIKPVIINIKNTIRNLNNSNGCPVIEYITIQNNPVDKI